MKIPIEHRVPASKGGLRAILIICLAGDLPDSEEIMLRRSQASASTVVATNGVTQCTHQPEGAGVDRSTEVGAFGVVVVCIRDLGEIQVACGSAPGGLGEGRLPATTDRIEDEEGTSHL